MTTTVRVRVNGQYRATVRINGGDPIVIEGNYNGGPGRRGFYLPHSKTAVFDISEEYVADDDKRPVDSD